MKEEKRKKSGKDKKKIVRGILEGIIVLFLVFLIFFALFSFNRYEPYDAEDPEIVSGEDNGFVALSYFGVALDGTSTLIAQSRLDEQLKALYDNGYVTISQEDIRNYYENGEPLPDKALFLMFEDGRNDTAIFAQKILEKYNFKASMMSYADKFDNQDPKFLDGDGLNKLVDSTFWELGTNGYRLSYINVFDRYNRYLGQLDSLQYSQVAQYLGRDYNHYLMDYIRDEDDVPLETYTEMENRIGYDYENMERNYTEALGELPGLYVLMHANTGQFGNNDKVSAVNEKWITELFSMNFNREGFSFNNRESSIYDLTRMQPQAYWYPNHVLMRIKYDSGADIQFTDGDTEEKAFWEELAGASEFGEEKIIITSEPEAFGLLKLKEEIQQQDIGLSVRLTGNKAGMQAIYLGADEDRSSYLKLELLNNEIYIYSCQNGAETLLFQENLDVHDGIEYKTIEEDMNDTFKGESEVNLRYAESVEDAKAQYEKVQAASEREAQLAEGTEDSEYYVPELQLNELGDRQVELSLTGGLLTVDIDGKNLVENLETGRDGSGYVFLESAWPQDTYSQRNLTDDVYDGVFEKLEITSANGQEVIYDNLFHGVEKVALEAGRVWNRVVNWFIDTL